MCPVSGPVASSWWGQGPKEEHTGLTAGPETSPRAPSRPCGSPGTRPLPTQPLGKPAPLHQRPHCPPKALSPPGPGHLHMTQG